MRSARARKGAVRGAIQPQDHPDTRLRVVQELIASVADDDDPAEDEVTDWSTQSLTTLECDVRALFHTKQLCRIPAAHFQRLQQKCEQVLTKRPLDGEPCDTSGHVSDIAWSRTIATAHQSTTCSILVLYSIIGRRGDDGLVGEEALERCATVLTAVLDGHILPVADRASRAATNSSPEAATNRTPATAINSHKGAATDVSCQTPKPKAEFESLLRSCTSLLDLLTTVLVDIVGSDALVAKTAFAACRLVFASLAAARARKGVDSRMWIECGDRATANLSRLYIHRPRERPGILNEVLGSLDKPVFLPRHALKRSTPENVPLQPLTTLLLLFVQGPSLDLFLGRERRSWHGSARRPSTTSLDEADEEVGSEGTSPSTDPDKADEVWPEDTSLGTDPDEAAWRRLTQWNGGVRNEARSTARIVASYLVGRASTSTKTGESPFRSGLACVLEDLAGVVDRCEWPAAEILLSTFTTHLLDLTTSLRNASVLHFAIESLGMLGSTVAKLRNRLESELPGVLESHGGAYPGLTDLARIYFSTGRVAAPDLLRADGPLRVATDVLGDACGDDTLDRKSARAYSVALWAHILARDRGYLDEHRLWGAVAHVLNFLDGENCDCLVPPEQSSLPPEQSSVLSVQSSVPPEQSPVQPFVESSLPPEQSPEQPSLPPVPAHVAQTAYLLCVVHQPFCQRLGPILDALSRCLASRNALVRAQSLRSLSAICESGPTLLDQNHHVAEQILECTQDASPTVREQAVALTAAYVGLCGGALSHRNMVCLVQRADDESAGVRKRAMAGLKMVHDRGVAPNVTDAVLDCFLPRLRDLDPTVALLAQRSLEEIFVRPVILALDEDESDTGLRAVADLSATLVSRAAAYDPDILYQFFASLRKAPDHSDQFAVLCPRLVEFLLSKATSGPDDHVALTALAALARVDPALLDAAQISRLLRSLDDPRCGSGLSTCLLVAQICRAVMPGLETPPVDGLLPLQNRLLQAISQASSRRPQLDQIMQCLAVIDELVHNTERLIRLAVSTVKRATAPGTHDDRLQRLLRVMGSMGQYLPLDRHTPRFVDLLPDLTAGSWSAHLVGVLTSLATSCGTAATRAIALDSLGSVCQSRPAHFEDDRVRSLFTGTLRDGIDYGYNHGASHGPGHGISHGADHSTSHGANHGANSGAEHGANVGTNAETASLIRPVLRTLAELFTSAPVDAPATAGETCRDGGQALDSIGNDSEPGPPVHVLSSVVGDNIASLLHIATSEVSENAYLAAKTLAGICEHGLVHPMQCLSTFVVLGTSADGSIAHTADKAHRYLHQQHASVCEREYAAAITQAFVYQNLVAKDSTGASTGTSPGYRAKLERCYRVVSADSIRHIQALFDSMLNRVNLDRRERSGVPVDMDHVLLTRFVAQNFAFLEYQRIDHLLYVFRGLEAVFHRRATSMAARVEALEAESPVFQVPDQGSDPVFQMPEQEPDPVLQVPEQDSDPVFQGPEQDLGFAGGDTRARPSTVKQVDPVLLLEMKRLGPSAACLLLLMEAHSHLAAQYGLSRKTQVPLRAMHDRPRKPHGLTGQGFWNRSNEIVASLETEDGAVQICRDLATASNIPENTKLVRKRVRESVGRKRKVKRRKKSTHRT